MVCGNNIVRNKGRGRTIGRLEDDWTIGERYGVGIGVIRIGLGLDWGIWYRIEWGWDLWCMYLTDGWR